MTKIYCAIDTPDHARALELAKAMASVPGCGIKLGLEYFSFNGAKGISDIRTAFPDLPLFLDLKYHDIPNTVASAFRAFAQLGVDYINLHAAGGREMMVMARETLADEAAKLSKPVPKILAVTVLTSLDDANLQSVGQSVPAKDQVLRLAHLTKESGLAGIVCSAHEITAVRETLGPDFVLMVPGIRPAGSDKGDQKRVMTPEEAFKAGATHLVIGRPITGASDPSRAAADIIASL
jgi:orotidine-5'-phosphate decarboxylase